MSGKDFTSLLMSVIMMLKVGTVLEHFVEVEEHRGRRTHKVN